MIKFWNKKSNKSWMQLTASLVVFCFLFSTISAPFAQASFWSERRKAVEEYQKSTHASTAQSANSQNLGFQVASAAGFSGAEIGSLGLNSISNKLEVSGIESKLSSEVMKRVMDKVSSRGASLKNKKNRVSLGLPPEFVNAIETYGEIERVYLSKGMNLKMADHKLVLSGEGLRLNSISSISSNPLVILVQEAHDIYGVQANIAYLLMDAVKMGVEIVGVEGSHGVMQGLEKWRNHPDKESVMGVAGYLLREGLLSGVEVAGLSLKAGEDVVKFYGVEDKEEYLEQVKSFKDTLTFNKEVKDWQIEIEKKLAELKEENYTLELKELDLWKNNYEAGNKKLAEWVEFLHARIERVYGGRNSHYPNVAKYLKAYKIEKQIDFKKIEMDQKKILQGLAEKLNRGELTELLEDSLLYRLGKMGYAEFYESIREKCKRANLKMTPDMEQYIQYLIGVEGIERAKLFQEAKDLENEAWLMMAGKPSGSHNNQATAEVVQADKDYRLIKKGLDFKLNVEEWKEYISRAEKIESGLSALSLRPFKGEVKQALENVKRFNQLSEERNEIFLKNLFGNSSQSKIVALVAGGYHASGIEERLRKKNISFITIRPKMQSGEIKNEYHPLNSFKRDLLPLEKMFMPEKVTLAPQRAMGTVVVDGALVASAVGAEGTMSTVVPVLGFSHGRADVDNQIENERNEGDAIVGEVFVENGDNYEVKVLALDAAVKETEIQDGAVAIKTDYSFLQKTQTEKLKPEQVVVKGIGGKLSKVKKALIAAGAIAATIVAGIIALPQVVDAKELVKELTKGAVENAQKHPEPNWWIALLVVGAVVAVMVYFYRRSRGEVPGSKNYVLYGHEAQRLIRLGVRYYNRGKYDKANGEFLAAKWSIGKAIALRAKMIDLNDEMTYAQLQAVHRFAEVLRKMGNQRGADSLTEYISEIYKQIDPLGQFEPAKPESRGWLSRMFTLALTIPLGIGFGIAGGSTGSLEDVLELNPAETDFENFIMMVRDQASSRIRTILEGEDLAEGKIEERIIQHLTNLFASSGKVNSVQVLDEDSKALLGNYEILYLSDGGEYRVELFQDRFDLVNKSNLSVGTFIAIYDLENNLVGTIALINGPITVMIVSNGKDKIEHFAYNGEQFLKREMSLDLSKETKKDKSPAAIGGSFTQWPKPFRDFYIANKKGIPGTDPKASSLKTRYSGVSGIPALGANLYEILINNGFMAELVAPQTAKIIASFIRAAGGEAVALTSKGLVAIENIPADEAVVQLYAGNKGVVEKLAEDQIFKEATEVKFLTEKHVPEQVIEIDLPNPLEVVDEEDDSLAGFLKQLPFTEENQDLRNAMLAIEKAAAKVPGLYVIGGKATGEIDSGGADQRVIDNITDELFGGTEERPQDGVRPYVWGYHSEEDRINYENGDGDHFAFIGDPLDGSSKVESNGGGGTIGAFLHLPNPKDSDGKRKEGLIEQASGRDIRAAFFVTYGNETKLVFAYKGLGAHEFVLRGGKFQYVKRINLKEKENLSKPIRVALGGSGSKWPKGFPELVDEWMNQGSENGYAGAMVTDVYGVLQHILDGGRAVFAYLENKLRTRYELAPMAFIMEEAGGASLTHEVGEGDKNPAAVNVRSMLDLKFRLEKDQKDHQRAPVALGDSATIAEIRQAIDQHVSGITFPSADQVVQDRAGNQMTVGEIRQGLLEKPSAPGIEQFTELDSFLQWLVTIRKNFQSLVKRTFAPNTFLGIAIRAPLGLSGALGMAGAGVVAGRIADEGKKPEVASLFHNSVRLPDPDYTQYKNEVDLYESLENYWRRQLRDESEDTIRAIALGHYIAKTGRRYERFKSVINYQLSQMTYRELAQIANADYKRREELREKYLSSHLKLDDLKLIVEKEQSIQSIAAQRLLEPYEKIGIHQSVIPDFFKPAAISAYLLIDSTELTILARLQVLREVVTQARYLWETVLPVGAIWRNHQGYVDILGRRYPEDQFKQLGNFRFIASWFDWVSLATLGYIHGLSQSLGRDVNSPEVKDWRKEDQYHFSNLVYYTLAVQRGLNSLMQKEGDKFRFENRWVGDILKILISSRRNGMVLIECPNIKNLFSNFGFTNDIYAPELVRIAESAVSAGVDGFSAEDISNAKRHELNKDISTSEVRGRMTEYRKFVEESSPQEVENRIMEALQRGVNRIDSEGYRKARALMEIAVQQRKEIGDEGYIRLYQEFLKTESWSNRYHLWFGKDFVVEILGDAINAEMKWMTSEMVTQWAYDRGAFTKPNWTDRLLVPAVQHGVVNDPAIIREWISRMTSLGYTTSAAKIAAAAYANERKSIKRNDVEEILEDAVSSLSPDAKEQLFRIFSWNVMKAAHAAVPSITVAGILLAVGIGTIALISAHGGPVISAGLLSVADALNSIIQTAAAGSAVSVNTSSAVSGLEFDSSLMNSIGHGSVLGSIFSWSSRKWGNAPSSVQLDMRPSEGSAVKPLKESSEEDYDSLAWLKEIYENFLITSFLMAGMISSELHSNFTNLWIALKKVLLMSAVGMTGTIGGGVGGSGSDSSKSSGSDKSSSSGSSSGGSSGGESSDHRSRFGETRNANDFKSDWDKAIARDNIEWPSFILIGIGAAIVAAALWGFDLSAPADAMGLAALPLGQAFSGAGTAILAAAAGSGAGTAILAAAAGFVNIREQAQKLVIRDDIWRKYPEIFGNRIVNGRAVGVEHLIKKLTLELGPEFSNLLKDRRDFLKAVSDGTAKYGFLNPEHVIEDADGNELTVEEIRQGLIDNFNGVESDIRWRLNDKTPVPQEVLRPGLQGTGPAHALRMLMSAINAKTASWMFDWEDAGDDYGDKLYMAWKNLKEVLAGKWEDREYSEGGKTSKLKLPRGEWGSIFHRVPGIGIRNRQMWIGGERVPATIVAMVIHVLNNYESLKKNGSGIYFYIPKIETPQEALLIAKLLKALEEEIGVPRGTIKIEMLHERIRFTQNQEAIMWVLRDWLIGPNVGRWDFIASRVEMGKDDPNMVLPNPHDIKMTDETMTEYTRRNAILTVLAAIKNGKMVNGMPIGGMSAVMERNVPEEGEPIEKMQAANEKAVRDIWFDKLRERLTGLIEINGVQYDTYRQSWVATITEKYVRSGEEPLITPLDDLQNLVDRADAGELGRLKNLGLVDDQGKIKHYVVTKEDLENLWTDKKWDDLTRRPKGDISIDGIEYAATMSAEYGFGVLNGNQAVKIFDYKSDNGMMNDFATHEIFWHWMWTLAKHEVVLTKDGVMRDGTVIKAGTKVTPELIKMVLDKVYLAAEKKIDYLESKGLSKNDRRFSPLIMKILERQLIQKNEDGTYSHQDKWVTYGSRILLSIIELDPKNDEKLIDQIMDAVYSPTRKDVAEKVRSGEWDKKTLEAYDYVFDNPDAREFGSIQGVARRVYSHFMGGLQITGFYSWLNQVKEAIRIIYAWLNSPRFGRIAKNRNYTAEEIYSIISQKIITDKDYQDLMTRKLFSMMQQAQKTGIPIVTGGVMDGPSAGAMVERGVKALYFSGWQMSHHWGEPDLAKYPLDTIPKRIAEINKFLRNKHTDQVIRYNKMTDQLEDVFSELYKTLPNISKDDLVSRTQTRDYFIKMFVDVVKKDMAIFVDDLKEDADQKLYDLFSEIVINAIAHHVSQGHVNKDQRNALRETVFHTLENYLVDYLVPFYADGDTGHQSVEELTKEMIQAGSASIHFEDQLHGAKKCGHMAGKVLVSAAEHFRRLRTARKDADSLFSELVIIARTDAQAARLLQSDEDDMDHYFILGSTVKDLPTLAEVINLAQGKKNNWRMKQIETKFPAIAAAIKTAWKSAGIVDGKKLDMDSPVLRGRGVSADPFVYYSYRNIWEAQEEIELDEHYFKLDTIIEDENKNMVTVQHILNIKPANLDKQEKALQELTEVWNEEAKLKTFTQAAAREIKNEEVKELWLKLTHPLTHVDDRAAIIEKLAELVPGMDKDQMTDLLNPENIFLSIHLMRALAETLGVHIDWDWDKPRTADGGYYQIDKNLGVLNATLRLRLFAQIADVVWMEQEKPDIKQAKELHDNVVNDPYHPEVKDVIFAANLSPSFNWLDPKGWSSVLTEQQIENIKLAKKLEGFAWDNPESWGPYGDDVHAMLEAIANFSVDMGRIGFGFQFVTILQDHTSTLHMSRVAKEILRLGAAGYVFKVQMLEQLDGSRFEKHQTSAGVKRVSRKEALVMRGASSTGAAGKDSTENQFGDDGASKKLSVRFISMDDESLSKFLENSVIVGSWLATVGISAAVAFGVIANAVDAYSGGALSGWNVLELALGLSGLFGAIWAAKHVEANTTLGRIIRAPLVLSGALGMSGGSDDGRVFMSRISGARVPKALRKVLGRVLDSAEIAKLEKIEELLGIELSDYPEEVQAGVLTLLSKNDFENSSSRQRLNLSINLENMLSAVHHQLISRIKILAQLFDIQLKNSLVKRKIFSLKYLMEYQQREEKVRIQYVSMEGGKRELAEVFGFVTKIDQESETVEITGESDAVPAEVFESSSAPLPIIAEALLKRRSETIPLAAILSIKPFGIARANERDPLEALEVNVDLKKLEELLTVKLSDYPSEVQVNLLAVLTGNDLGPLNSDDIKNTLVRTNQVIKQINLQLSLSFKLLTELFKYSLGRFSIQKQMELLKQMSDSKISGAPVVITIIEDASPGETKSLVGFIESIDKFAKTVELTGRSNPIRLDEISSVSQISENEMERIKRLISLTTVKNGRVTLNVPNQTIIFVNLVEVNVIDRTIVVQGKYKQRAVLGFNQFTNAESGYDTDVISNLKNTFKDLGIPMVEPSSVGVQVLSSIAVLIGLGALLWGLPLADATNAMGLGAIPAVQAFNWGSGAVLAGIGHAAATLGAAAVLALAGLTLQMIIPGAAHAFPSIRGIPPQTIAWLTGAVPFVPATVYMAARFAKSYLLSAAQTPEALEKNVRVARHLNQNEFLARASSLIKVHTQTIDSRVNQIQKANEFERIEKIKQALQALGYEYGLSQDRAAAKEGTEAILRTAFKEFSVEVPVIKELTSTFDERAAVVSSQDVQSARKLAEIVQLFDRQNQNKSALSFKQAEEFSSIVKEGYRKALLDKGIASLKNVALAGLSKESEMFELSALFLNDKESVAGAEYVLTQLKERTKNGIGEGERILLSRLGSVDSFRTELKANLIEKMGSEDGEALYLILDEAYIQGRVKFAGETEADASKVNADKIYEDFGWWLGPNFRIITDDASRLALGNLNATIVRIIELVSGREGRDVTRLIIGIDKKLQGKRVVDIQA